MLCELEIDRLPVDPWKIAEALPNVHICKWTVLRDNCGDPDPLFINKEGADAKTQHLRGQADYLVVYDDRVENYQRVRWTIAHEIGHIVLGHLVSFDATALCRGTLTEAEYKVLEREADTFAVNLLVPMTIINRLPSIKTKADFMELCDLSGKASDNCMEELRMLKSGQKIPFPIRQRIFCTVSSSGSSMNITVQKYPRCNTTTWRLMKNSMTTSSATIGISR